jgi:hypothetical protein
MELSTNLELTPHGLAKFIHGLFNPDGMFLENTSTWSDHWSESSVTDVK